MINTTLPQQHPSLKFEQSSMLSDGEDDTASFTSEDGEFFTINLDDDDKDHKVQVSLDEPITRQGPSSDPPPNSSKKVALSDKPQNKVQNELREKGWLNLFGKPTSNQRRTTQPKSKACVQQQKQRDQPTATYTRTQKYPQPLLSKPRTSTRPHDTTKQPKTTDRPSSQNVRKEQPLLQQITNFCKLT